MLAAAKYDPQFRGLGIEDGGLSAWRADPGPAVRKLAWEQQLHTGSSALTKSMKLKEWAKRLENAEIFQLSKVRSIFSGRWMANLSWATPKCGWIKGWNANYCNLDKANQFTLLNFLHARIGWSFSMSIQIQEWATRGFRTLPNGKVVLLDEDHVKACYNLAYTIPLNCFSSLVKGIGVCQDYMDSTRFD